MSNVLKDIYKSKGKLENYFDDRTSVDLWRGQKRDLIKKARGALYPELDGFKRGNGTFRIPEVELTDQAVVTAARALIIENKRCAAKLKDATLSDEQAEYLGDYLQLLDAAMGEIEALYVQRQATNQHMGSFDALYQSVLLDRD